MRNSLVGIALATLLIAVTADAQSVSFARWKNNATGAYSLSHDDAGYSWWADYAYVDSLLHNRGLTVSFNMIAGLATRTDSMRAAAFIRHGYRYNNHSMNHICDTPLTAQATMNVEYDSAKALIERKFAPSQGKCLYFMAPCGNQSAANIDHLRAREYIGCRNDINGVSPVPYNVPDPFRIGEACYSAGEDLNASAQVAITSGNWVTRYGHCVSDNSSLGWMPIPLATYRAHLDWCKQQVDAGVLWMAPTQTVLMYALERSRWGVAVTSSGAASMQITINTDSVINPHVDNHLFNVALTLLAGLPSGWSAQDAQAVQQGVELAKVVANSTTIRFDANPWAGIVTINRTAVPVLSQPLRPVQPGVVAAAAVFGLDGRLVGRTSSGSAAALVRWDYAGHAGVTILQIRQ
jgi:hypothetical protein